MDSPTVHQVTYIFSIRSQYRQVGSPLFRGTLETLAGQKFTFSTLAELNNLLCEIAGWIDTPPMAEKGGEAKTSSKASDAKGCDQESYESGFAPDRNFKEEKK